jgi:membrane fusion protein (multidrug efflux system)
VSHSRLQPHPAAIACLLGATLGAGCRQQAATAPPRAPAAQAVTVVTLKPQTVTLTRELPGRVNAYLIAEVRPQVNGIVKKRLFTEGAPVKAGQPLYQLEDSAYRADYANAAAALTRARATLKAAQLNARRSAELVRIDAVSQQDNENAAAALNQAKADVAAFEAALQGRKVILDYARIDAPISGQAGKSSVTQGALVTANQATALVTVQQLDPVNVDLTQSSSELLQLRRELAAGTLSRPGDLPVQVVLEDGATYSQAGKLAFADISVDPTTGSFAVRVTVPNPNQVLLPGMYVRALVGNGVRRNALLVPQKAIARDPKGNASAMLVGPDGKVQLRTVRTSRVIGNQWLIDDGLAAGDRVIVEGLQKIKPGAAVVVTEAQDTAPAAAAGLARGAAGPL